MAIYALVLLVAVSVAGSFVPFPTKIALGAAGPWHDPFHILLFTLTGLFARLSFRRVPVFAVALAVTLFGFALEWTEHLCYDNPLEWWDIGSDTLGCLIGVALSFLFRKPSNAE